VFLLAQGFVYEKPQQGKKYSEFSARLLEPEG
jgi:hypothetical protein